jgi:hypothetical protein
MFSERNMNLQFGGIFKIIFNEQVTLNGGIRNLAINHALFNAMYLRKPQEAMWKSPLWK